MNTLLHELANSAHVTPICLSISAKPQQNKCILVAVYCHVLVLLFATLFKVIACSAKAIFVATAF